MEREKTITESKLCVKCDHKNVCMHKTYMRRRRTCDYFKDEALVLILPCQPGTTVCKVDKNCDACSCYREAPFSDCVSCVNDHDLYDPTVQSELCKQHIRFRPVDFKPHMIEQFGLSIFLSPDDFWAKNAERTEE